MHHFLVLAAIRSAAVQGVTAYDVTVEVDASKGLPNWFIVGLAANAVKEARERVSAALTNSGFFVPPRRYTINLAPGDTRKDGTAFDLPIALGVLVATGQLSPQTTQGLAAVGELGLDGSLRSVRGVLPICVHFGRQISSIQALIVPPSNAFEGSLVNNLSLMAPPTLSELVSALQGGPEDRTSLVPNDQLLRAELPKMASERLDLADVAGQETAKRALEIAAAGGHALLMVGPPGAGKTMLARRLPSILPPLTSSEALEVLSVHSVAGLIGGVDLHNVQRPFRAPHHTLSSAALIGGGSHPRPGEVSLAHLGVLFLDELQEMPRSLLDALRQPLEDGRVLISRAQQSISFPSRFSLVGAMNPCPCGFLGDASRACTCPAADIAKHRSRVSGPLADRIDMTITVPPVALTSLGTSGETNSADVRNRVVFAREMQRARYSRHSAVSCNAQASGRWLDAHSAIAPDARQVLLAAAERLGLSARGFHRVIKVARTIADLDQSATVTRQHAAEALFFRSGDKARIADGERVPPSRATA